MIYPTPTPPPPQIKQKCTQAPLQLTWLVAVLQERQVDRDRRLALNLTARIVARSREAGFRTCPSPHWHHRLPPLPLRQAGNEGNLPLNSTPPPQKRKKKETRLGQSHIPGIAFRHLPPNSARFSYAIKGALFISAQLSSDAVSALRKVRVLI